MMNAKKSMRFDVGVEIVISEWLLPSRLALAENEVASVGSNMVVALAGVTQALIAASLSFVVLPDGRMVYVPE